MAKVTSTSSEPRCPALRYIRENNLWPELAKACGISRQAAPQWRQVPSNRVLIVEKLTGIPRYKIRPDIFPRE